MYDANKSYAQNYNDGPNAQLVRNHHFPKIEYLEKPQFQFLGIPLFIPFGVPAGPLLNAKFVQVALNAGFCLPTYKTVRSCVWESHPWPNVLKINKIENTDISSVIGTPFSNADYQQAHLSISNSFGVPSQAPKVWSQDFQTLQPYVQQTGYHVVLSFQGTRNPQTKKSLWADIVEICQYAVECVEKTGFVLLEINLSCPNEDNEPLYKVRKDAIQALKCAYEILQNHKNIKLIAKIGVLNSEDTYAFLSEVSPYVQGLSAINTLSATIVNSGGQVVLGSGSLTGGVCGELILQHGLKMCENLSAAREKCGLKANDFGLIGVGGVSEVAHFQSYRNAGADIVQAATGMMWNLDLAKDIARFLRVKYDITRTKS
jgi:dihydroorotate dehydrogenase (NAD+) catalytic subunit